MTEKKIKKDLIAELKSNNTDWDIVVELVDSVIKEKDKTWEDDMTSLESLFFDHLKLWDGGYIGLEAKKPFGNSFIEGDILEAIDATPEGDDQGYEDCWSDEQIAYARELYHDLADWLRNKYGSS